MSVTIRSRVEKFTGDLAGKTVRDIRNDFGKVLNISAQATPMIDGEPVEEGYTLSDGETLNFSVALGEKGR